MAAQCSSFQSDLQPSIRRHSDWNLRIPEGSVLGIAVKDISRCSPEPLLTQLNAGSAHFRSDLQPSVRRRHSYSELRLTDQSFVDFPQKSFDRNLTITVSTQDDTPCPAVHSDLQPSNRKSRQTDVIPDTRARITSVPLQGRSLHRSHLAISTVRETDVYDTLLNGEHSTVIDLLKEKHVPEIGIHKQIGSFSSHENFLNLAQTHNRIVPKDNCLDLQANSNSVYVCTSKRKQSLPLESCQLSNAKRPENGVGFCQSAESMDPGFSQPIHTLSDKSLSLKCDSSGNVLKPQEEKSSVSCCCSQKYQTLTAVTGSEPVSITSVKRRTSLPLESETTYLQHVGEGPVGFNRNSQVVPNKSIKLHDNATKLCHNVARKMKRQLSLPSESLSHVLNKTVHSENSSEIEPSRRPVLSFCLGASGQRKVSLPLDTESQTQDQSVSVSGLCDVDGQVETNTSPCSDQPAVCTSGQCDKLQPNNHQKNLKTADTDASGSGEVWKSCDDESDHVTRKRKRKRLISGTKKLVSSCDKSQVQPVINKRRKLKNNLKELARKVTKESASQVAETAKAASFSGTCAKRKVHTMDKKTFVTAALDGGNEDETSDRLLSSVKRVSRKNTTKQRNRKLKKLDKEQRMINKIHKTIASSTPTVDSEEYDLENIIPLDLCVPSTQNVRKAKLQTETKNGSLYRRITNDAIWRNVISKY